MNENKLQCKYINAHCGSSTVSILDSNLQFCADFEYCEYKKIIKTIPYSLKYNNEYNKNNEKQKRSDNFYTASKFRVTNMFIFDLQYIGFAKTIVKIFYYYVDNNNTSFYKILGKSKIDNTEIYFYTEYQENSMGFSNHSLYFSYEYEDLIKYCMPFNHVEKFVSLYDI